MCILHFKARTEGFQANNLLRPAKSLLGPSSPFKFHIPFHIYIGFIPRQSGDLFIPLRSSPPLYRDNGKYLNTISTGLRWFGRCLGGLVRDSGPFSCAICGRRLTLWYVIGRCQQWQVIILPTRPRWRFLPRVRLSVSFSVPCIGT